MSEPSKKIRPPPVTPSALRMPGSPTSAGGAGGLSSPVARQYTHAPYLSTNNILATEDLNAAEYESMMARGKRRDGGAPGSPTANLSGSYSNAFTGSPTHSNASALPSGKKNVCRHFINGNCNRGSSCRFYHPGSIHRVVTPSRPRTPTQRPLTPLADLAQQQQQQLTSAFAVTSPVHSPSLSPSAGGGGSAAPMNYNGGSPLYGRPMPRPVIDNISANDNNSSYVSPLSSPAHSHAQRVPYALLPGQSSTSATPPTLSSPSIGPQISAVPPGVTVAERRGAALQAIPSLQLPGCMVSSTQGEGHDGNVSGGPADATVLSAPHSPTTPGAHRLPLYRFNARTGTAASPPVFQSASRTASSSNNTSGRQDANETSVGSSQNAQGGQLETPQRSPVPANTTRNNPYAYPGSPGGVQRQPKEPMSPLKRAPSSFQSP